MRTCCSLLAISLLAACHKGDPGRAASNARATNADAGPPVAKYDRLARADFNRQAVRLNLPLYWIEDRNKDHAVQPDEIAALLFYPSEGQWVAGGRLTPAFATAYAQLLTAARPPAETAAEIERRRLVALDLDAGRATLVLSDLRGLTAGEKRFVTHMLAASRQVDELFDITTGAAALAPRVPTDDPASQSAFRRNRGPQCAAPGLEQDPHCSAIPGAPKPVVDVYPAALQADEKFCATLQARPDARALLGHFTAVREQAGKLVAVPYSKAYAAQMAGIAAELTAAAAALPADREAPLVAYLTAAATAFGNDDWQPADEAWSRMNAQNSAWYVRVAPDEVYWEPCAIKAGFHLTFARINSGSLKWQEKLAPVQNDMEQAVAERAGAPYQAHPVTFHLPDFIDIVTNAGDDRGALGATVGQSLPNWGPVGDEGRGRTVAMSNLYTDPDSQAAHHTQAAALLDQASLALVVDDPEPGLLSTILHEATHNLGPAHDYKVGGRTDDEAFGGQLAAMLEELKAQTGALFLVEFLRARGILDDAAAQRVYADSIVWALGHIAEGMTTAEGDIKPYPQLACVQIGLLLDAGAITFDAAAPAANGTDRGAFTLHLDKMPAAADQMMRLVGGIKARGDKAAAEALAAKYVSGAVVPQALIAERLRRTPKANFVYAVEL